MEDEAEVIKHQMEETRTSLSEKLEALEQKVVSTVNETTGAISETVETVKDTVQGTIAAVNDTVENTICSVKETFDLHHQMEAHPWAMLAGSVAVGYLAGQLVFPAASGRMDRRAEPTGNGRERRFNYPEASAVTAAPQAASSAGGLTSSFLSSLGEALAPALDTLKGLAIGATANVLGDMLVNAVPQQFKGELCQAIDEITTQLGGRKFEHQTEPAASERPGNLPMPSSSGGASEQPGSHARRW
jgi:ElaB/YqjD/DUF883 family membrane-anchored ribosome-binding protein